MTYALLNCEPEKREALAHLEKVSPVDYRGLFYQRLWGAFKSRKDDTRMREGMKRVGFPLY